MKKKILLSLSTIVLTGLLMGGATYALFTDSAVDKNNFQAGSVSISANRDLGDPVPGPMFYTTKEQGLSDSGAQPNWETGLWYPTKSVTRTLIVQNTGSVDVNIDGISAVLSNVTDPAVATEFANEMEVVVKPQAMPLKIIYSGPLSGLLSGNKVAALNNLPTSSGGIWYLDFTVTMHEDAGNNLQGIDPRVAFSIYASQK